ncbi:MAG: hypothetical protein LBB56_03685 [Chitinispirillales bacterium]|nr:hypothetical protein [Chitinispirillales bacterium]
MEESAIGAAYKLKSYSAHQCQNWVGSKSIVVCENEKHLLRFIEDAMAKKNLGQKMYFGMISKELSERIRNDIKRTYPDIEVDLEGHNCALPADRIRHFFDAHGDENSEKLRGQMAVTNEDILMIPKIIEDYDFIKFNPNDTYKGRFVIRFVKEGRGRVTLVAYDSRKHKDLSAVSLYTGGNKNGSLATAVNA